MLEQYNELLTIDELCGILMVGKNIAYRLLTEKKIKAFRIGKKAVENFITENSR